MSHFLVSKCMTILKSIYFYCILMEQHNLWENTCFKKRPTLYIAVQKLKKVLLLVVVVYLWNQYFYLACHLNVSKETVKTCIMLQEKLYLERDVLLILRRKKKCGYHKIYLKQNQLVQQFSTVHKYSEVSNFSILSSKLPSKRHILYN